MNYMMILININISIILPLDRCLSLHYKNYPGSAKCSASCDEKTFIFLTKDLTGSRIPDRREASRSLIRSGLLEFAGTGAGHPLLKRVYFMLGLVMSDRVERIKKVPPQILTDLTPKHPEYVALCTKLGFMPTENDLRTERIQSYFDFLAAQEIPIYNTREVKDYLRRLCLAQNRWWNRKQSAAWFFHPLRRKDIANSFTFNTEVAERMYTRGNQNLTGGQEAQTVYRKLVPIDMLRRVDKIETNWTDLNVKVAFFITDFANVARPDPDPFLFVTFVANDKDGQILSDAQKGFFIGAWDEPGFE